VAGPLSHHGQDAHATLNVPQSRPAGVHPFNVSKPARGRVQAREGPCWLCALALCGAGGQGCHATSGDHGYMQHPAAAVQNGWKPFLLDVWGRGHEPLKLSHSPSGQARRCLKAKLALVAPRRHSGRGCRRDACGTAGAECPRDSRQDAGETPALRRDKMQAGRLRYTRVLARGPGRSGSTGGCTPTQIQPHPVRLGLRFSASTELLEKNVCLDWLALLYFGRVGGEEPLPTLES